MEERILVYKDEQGYEKLIGEYSFWKKELQELATGIKDMGISPEWMHIKQLLNGQNLKSLISSKSVSESVLESLPKLIKGTFQKILNDGIEEEYKKNISDRAERLQQIVFKGDMLVDLNYFSVDEKGVISLSPEYINQVESFFCVFVETDGQKEVYDKYLKFQEAVKELNDAVDRFAIDDKENTAINSIYHRSKIKAIGSVDSYNCLVYQYGDNLILRGENFKRIV